MSFVAKLDCYVDCCIECASLGTFQLMKDLLTCNLTSQAASIMENETFRSSFKGIITASACECELIPHNMQSAVLKQCYFMGLSSYCACIRSN